MSLPRPSPLSRVRRDGCSPFRSDSSPVDRAIAMGADLRGRSSRRHWRRGARCRAHRGLCQGSRLGRALSSRRPLDRRSGLIQPGVAELAGVPGYRRGPVGHLRRGISRRARRHPPTVPGSSVRRVRPGGSTGRARHVRLALGRPATGRPGRTDFPAYGATRAHGSRRSSCSTRSRWLPVRSWPPTSLLIPSTARAATESAGGLTLGEPGARRACTPSYRSKRAPRPNAVPVTVEAPTRANAWPELPGWWALSHRKGHLVRQGRDLPGLEVDQGGVGVDAGSAEGNSLRKLTRPLSGR